MNQCIRHWKRPREIVSHLTFSLVSAVVFSSIPANAATTSVSLNFPEVIVFHYISHLDLNFTQPAAGANQTSALQSATVNLPLSASRVNVDGGLDAGKLSAGQINEMAVNIGHFWAVRGITPSGRIQIKSNLDSALASNGLSSAKASHLTVTSNSVSGKQIDIAAPGLGQFTSGGISFSLDISNVINTGSHTGLRYTLEATAAP